MTEQSSKKYKHLADNCLRLAEHAVDEVSRRRYLRMVDAWLALAEEQEWLDRQVPVITAATAQNVEAP